MSIFLGPLWVHFADLCGSIRQANVSLFDGRLGSWYTVGTSDYNVFLQLKSTETEVVWGALSKHSNNFQLFTVVF